MKRQELIKLIRKNKLYAILLLISLYYAAKYWGTIYSLVFLLTGFVCVAQIVIGNRFLKRTILCIFLILIGIYYIYKAAFTGNDVFYWLLGSIAFIYGLLGLVYNVAKLVPHPLHGTNLSHKHQLEYQNLDSIGSSDFKFLDKKISKIGTICSTDIICLLQHENKQIPFVLSGCYKLTDCEDTPVLSLAVKDLGRNLLEMGPKGSAVLHRGDTWYNYDASIFKNQEFLGYNFESDEEKVETEAFIRDYAKGAFVSQDGTPLAYCREVRVPSARTSQTYKDIFDLDIVIQRETQMAPFLQRILEATNRTFEIPLNRREFKLAKIDPQFGAPLPDTISFENKAAINLQRVFLHGYISDRRYNKLAKTHYQKFSSALHSPETLLAYYQNHCEDTLGSFNRKVIMWMIIRKHPCIEAYKKFVADTKQKLCEEASALR